MFSISYRKTNKTVFFTEVCLLLQLMGKVILSGYQSGILEKRRAQFSHGFMFFYGIYWQNDLEILKVSIVATVTTTDGTWNRPPFL